MAQCLLIDDSEKISAIHSLNLKIFTGLDVICKPSLLKAVEFLDVVPNVDIIITKNKIKDTQVAIDLLSIVSQFEVPPVVLVLGGDDVLDQYPYVHCLSPVVTHQELIAKAAMVLGITAKDMANRKLPDMYEVPITYLKYLKEVVCNMFLMTNEVKGGASQFVEIGSVGDSLDELRENLAFYIKQGAKRFFIPTDSRISFVAAYTEQVLSTLGGGEEVTPKERMEATSAAMDAVSSDLVDHGFNETSIKLANESIKSLAKFAKENTNPKIFKLLGTFLKSKMSYRFKRVQLTMMLVNHAVKNMEWGANEHIEKLSYVAFFHDILLFKDEMARIRTDDELEESDLSEKEKRIVRHHALWTLDLLKDYPETHMGATVLIKQHHGSLNGIGFNQAPGSNISPLAIVFMVCEAYASEVLKMVEVDEDVNHKTIMNMLLKKYPKSQFQKVVKALKGISN
jgi:hypothetical protein